MVLKPAQALSTYTVSSLSLAVNIVCPLQKSMMSMENEQAWPGQKDRCRCLEVQRPSLSGNFATLLPLKCRTVNLYICQRKCILHYLGILTWIYLQLKSILGYATTSSNRVYLQLYYIFKNIGNFQWKEFVMGGSMLILLFGMQFLSQRFPR